MTLTLELSPKAEEELRNRASIKGVPLSQLAAGILEKDAISGPDAGSETSPSGNEALLRAREFYNRELRAKLEAEHLNEYVAIHPDSGDYLIDCWPGRSRRRLKERHPEGSVIVRHIGIADDGLRARIRGERP